jgi:hypothetical protein
MSRLSLFVIFLSIMAACRPVSDENIEEKGKLLAKAGGNELYFEELKPYLLNGLNTRDSMKHVQRLIEQWAINELMYVNAKEVLSDNEKSIEKEVKRYRQELLNHKFEEMLINENLDTTITKAEIENYYNEHKDNFILKDNIVKVNYVKIVTASNAIDKIKKLLQSKEAKDKEQLKSLCLQQADNYFLNDSTWLLLDDIKKEIPRLTEEADINYTTGKVIEYTDNGYYYYLKIKDIRIKNSLSPLNFERQTIKKFILNSRKADLIKQYKHELLEKAKSDKMWLVF